MQNKVQHVVLCKKGHEDMVLSVICSAVGNSAWSAMHPFAGLRNLEKARSDHRPICLDTIYLAGVAEQVDASPMQV
jgi:hypothetical protein